MPADQHWPNISLDTLGMMVGHLNHGEPGFFEHSLVGEVLVDRSEASSVVFMLSNTAAHRVVTDGADQL